MVASELATFAVQMLQNAIWTFWRFKILNFCDDWESSVNLLLNSTVYKVPNYSLKSKQKNCYSFVFLYDFCNNDLFEKVLVQQNKLLKPMTLSDL